MPIKCTLFLMYMYTIKLRMHLLDSVPFPESVK